MMAANYRHIGGGENRLGRHYSRFSGIWLTSFFADQSLTLRKSQNAGSNRPSRASSEASARQIVVNDGRISRTVDDILDFTEAPSPMVIRRCWSRLFARFAA